MTTPPLIAVLGGVRETAAIVHALPHPCCVLWGDEAEATDLPVPVVAHVPLDTHAVLDATHPFDTTTRATLPLALPYVRFQRPLWTPEAGDTWTEVADIDAAISALPKGARVLAATGYPSMLMLARHDGPVFLRQLRARGSASPPDNCRLLHGPGPFDVDEEVALFQRLSIEAVLARNVGGPDSFPKIAAARHLGLPVVLLRPPPVPPGRVLQSIDAVAAWARTL